MTALCASCGGSSKSSKKTEVVPPVFGGIEKAAATDSDTVILSWKMAQDNVTDQTKIRYLVFMAESPGGEAFSKPDFTTGAPYGITGYAVTGLKPNTSYYFVARARDEAGNSDMNMVEKSAKTLMACSPLPTGQADSPVTSVKVSAVNPRKVMAAIKAGALVSSDDGGDSWKTGSVPGAGFTPTSLTLDKTRDSTAYASTSDRGVLRTADGGATWSEANAGISNLWVLSIAISQVNSLRLFAGTKDVDGNRPGNVFVSDNAGNSWYFYGQNILMSATNADMRQIAPDPNTSRLYCATNHGLYLSDDLGQTWVPAANTPDFNILSVAADPFNLDYILAGTNGSGVFFSASAGRSWSQGFATDSKAVVYAIAYSPSRANVVYIGTSSGLLRSDDSGKNWARFGGGMNGENVLSVAVDPQDENRVFAGTERKGLLRCQP